MTRKHSRDEVMALLFGVTLLCACGDGGAAEIARLTEEATTKASELEASQKEATDLAAKLATLEAAKVELAGELEEVQGKATELEEKQGALEGELEKSKSKVESLEVIQSELGQALVAEVEAGDITVSRRDGMLVVDVSDKVLFDTGKAEIKEKGKAILDKLAASLMKLPKTTVFQVGGHTDDQPIKSEEVKAVFPTNWELSAARATQVVRHLQEVSGIPGKRLVAAGFAEFRPAASNRKPKGRQKNRRIEIALVVR